MPVVRKIERRKLLDKLEKGGFSAPRRTSGTDGAFNTAKAYNDANRALGKLFDFGLDMVEEVFDVKLSRTKHKRRGKVKLF